MDVIFSIILFMENSNILSCYLFSYFAQILFCFPPAIRLFIFGQSFAVLPVINIGSPEGLPICQDSDWTESLQPICLYS